MTTKKTVATIIYVAITLASEIFLVNCGHQKESNNTADSKVMGWSGPGTGAVNDGSACNGSYRAPRQDEINRCIRMNKGAGAAAGVLISVIPGAGVVGKVAGAGIGLAAGDSSTATRCAATWICDNPKHADLRNNRGF